MHLCVGNIQQPNEVVAVVEMLGEPDYFINLSPNDNWPQIQATIKKAEELVLNRG